VLFGLRASGFRLPAFGFRLSASGFRLPASGFRLSAFGFRFSAFGFRLSVFGFRLPASGFGFWNDDLDARKKLGLSFDKIPGISELRIPSLPLIRLKYCKQATYSQNIASRGLRLFCLR
jgi:hypothetical protein